MKHQDERCSVSGTRHALRVRAGGVVIAGAIAGLFCAVAAAQAQVPESCEQAGRAAEQNFALPPGLLVAIGRVESGRWDDSRHQFTAWPWSVDVDGAAHRHANAEAALLDVRTLRNEGGHSIDVGCFQINLGWHPGAFTSLEEAFDPVANANYAASFLLALKQRLGSWPAAVAAYHSANPELGIPYRDRVMAIWETAPAAPEVWQPVTERFGIRVWTPNASTGGYSAAANGSAQADGALPHIITPTR